MSFVAEGGDGVSGLVLSPGGHEFGIQGWSWGAPIPRSITFFTDGSAMVCDQYGRQIRRAVTPDGVEVLFADKPPEANNDGETMPRPMFASHAKVLETLAAERIDWLAYEVRYVSKGGGPKKVSALGLPKAREVMERLVRDGNGAVQVCREIASAGWPQLPYKALKALPEGILPRVPADSLARSARLAELRKIPDRQMRADAIKVWHELVEARLAAEPTEEAEIS